jgi:hypothetical protein
MSRKFSRFFAVSEAIFRHCKLPMLALGIAAPATLAALPSIALMSQGRAYFAAPPVLIRSGATHQTAKQPFTYEFIVQVPQNAGEPLKALKITQRPGADTITLDQSRIRAETVGEVRLSQAMDSQSALQPPVSSQSLTKSPADLQSSSPEMGAMPSLPIGEMPQSTQGQVQPSTPEGTQLSPSNPRQRSGLDPQYYSYEAIRARAMQPAYSGPTQPGAPADSTSMQATDVDRVGSMRSEKRLTLASVGGDDLVPGEAIVQFDPPVAPGTTVRVSIPAIANPQSGGTYLFGVTAFPAGENSSGQFLGYSQIRFYQN